VKFLTEVIRFINAMHPVVFQLKIVLEEKQDLLGQVSRLWKREELKL
jgi:hypothetical protein